jgi:hypothetical protein
MNNSLRSLLPNKSLYEIDKILLDEHTKILDRDLKGRVCGVNKIEYYKATINMIERILEEKK